MSDASAKSSTPSVVSPEQLRLVLDVARSLAVTADIDPLLAKIARAGAAMLACERASVFLHDNVTDELWTTVALQSDPIRVPARTGIVGECFSCNQVIHCPDAYADARFNPQPDRQSGFVTRDLLAAPMVDRDAKPLGVLQAVNKIAGGFTETDAALLRLLADQAGVAIQRSELQRQAVRASGLQHEMQLARRIQEAMIPRRPPQLLGLSCAGWTLPASINGGDCFDLWTCGSRLGVLSADASGHGMGPALVVSQVRSLVRALCETESDPARLLQRIDERLSADLEPGRFVTAFLAFVSPNGLVQWCNAGNGPAAIISRDGTSRLLEPLAPPLGLMGHVSPDVAPPARLEAGESLIVVSDGVTEAFDQSGELLGLERLMAELQKDAAMSPADLITQIRRLVSAWQKRDEPADDQTAVVIRRD